jgi:hypothetical protein
LEKNSNHPPISLLYKYFAYNNKLALTKQLPMTVANMICKVDHITLEHLVFHAFRVAENIQCVNKTLPNKYLSQCYLQFDKDLHSFRHVTLTHGQLVTPKLHNEIISHYSDDLRTIHHQIYITCKTV